MTDWEDLKRYVEKNGFDLVIGDKNAAMVASSSRGKAILLCDAARPHANGVEVPDVTDADAMFDLFGQVSDRLTRLIVVFDDKRLNVEFARRFAERASKTEPCDLSLREPRGLHCYVLGSTEELEPFVEATGGRLHAIDAPRLAAMDFIANYPITEFMGERELDVSTATVRQDADINVALVGFGERQKELYLALVANSQLMTLVDGEVREKTIKYWIYDKNHSEKGANSEYFLRYNAMYGELVAHKDEYLPLPDMPSEEIYINSLDALDLGGYCMIVVDMGEDEENLSVASELAKRFKGKGNVHVFARQKKRGECGEVIGFGFEDESFCFDRIVNSSFELMAKDRHFCYSLEYSGAPKNRDEEISLFRKAIADWYGASKQAQRDSNVYACLSLKMKFQLMGLDLVRGEGDLDAREEFSRAYAAGDEIVYTGEMINGKGVVDYGDCLFRRGTVRNILAMQEHDRWNAYMMSMGFVPASIEDIRLKSKAEMLKERKHANLTTYDGLLTYRRLKAEWLGKTEAETDVIKYDYQLMDDALWLVLRNGFGIVKR